MKTRPEILSIAHNTLRMEAEGISALIPRVNNDFAVIIEYILHLKGRVIVTGVGKSAIIAQKIVSTFNSTGTPAVYMHAGDAIHGDLGIIQKDDVVMCLSRSGNTAEIKVLIPLLKQSGNKLIGMVGDLNSYLAKHSDLVLDVTVEKEACPHNLAPTTSTTAQMATGDAIAVCLLECREFTHEDFAQYHPGGSLGKRLYLKVKDLAINNEKPFVSLDTTIKDVIVRITKNRLGAVAVLNKNKIEGVITDGDIRRMMERYDSISGLTARDIMGTMPYRISEDELAVNALELMRTNNITQILVVKDNAYTGMVHLHDLLREGII